MHTTALCLCVAILSLSARANAQANFFESFDHAGSVNPGQLGPSGLIAAGWMFRRQANPQGSGTWSTFGQGWAYEGAACLAINSSVTTIGGTGAGWAILPVVPNLHAGDPVTFWVAQGYQVGGDPTGRLQLRYSTGGTSTGSGAGDVGDFTQVLIDIPGNPDGTPWTQFQGVAPGAGRLALRFYQPAGTQLNYASNFLVDSLRVGSPPNSTPFPEAGQTVHWTTAMSPINLPPQHQTIVSGGTVIVDPGVRVNIAEGYRLDVRGTLTVLEGATVNISAASFPPSELNVYGAASFTGTPAAPVSIIGGARDWAATTERVGAMPGGRITACYISLQSTFSALNTGVVIADHVTASGQYTGFFTSGQVYTTGGTIAVRDSTLADGAWININGGYLLIDRTTLDNATLYTSRYRSGQTMYLNNITARNNPDSCFHLTGYDHFFGPENSITGNGFPVHLYGAGIAHGSVLPATGNVNNLVHAGIGTNVGQSTFAAIGLAYRIDQDDSFPDNMGGSLKIEPGVTVKMGPGAYIPASFGSVLGLEGLPEAPITFERLDPAQAWVDLWFAVSNVRPRLEHCVIRGADRGVDADESIVRVDSCLFEDNNRGAFARNYGAAILRKSRFFSNAVGAQSSYGSPASGFGHGFIDADGNQGNPNWFEGNATGLETLNPFGDPDTARSNYWGSPTGPTDPTNPGGMGDSTPGANVVVPFLTSAPDFTDNPPLVRLEDHSFLFEEGDKVILHWTARDEGSIVKFQVWHSTHGDNPGLYLYVDNIPGTARSWEVVVPEAPPASNYPDPSVFRVVAIDERGQQGFDEIIFRTPWLHDVTGSIAAADMPSLVRPGEPMSVCLAPGQNFFDASLMLDADGQSYSLGGTTVNCLSGTQVAPPVSTDLARVVVSRADAGGRIFYGFSNYFSIRPDPMIGDAPPEVALTSPAPGASFAGGSIVPIGWAASDDESLRSFTIQASYNDGRTWHTVAADIPGSARSFAWRLPPSTGIPAVRVRVIARDLRFQNSSAQVALSILPGTGCPADWNGSGTVDSQDFFDFLGAFFAGAGDFNHSGATDSQDFFDFLGAFFAGC
jgi:hypothetical protein